MKFLISCTANLDDIVFSTALVRALKVRSVHSELHYNLPQAWHVVLQENPYIDKLIDLKGQFASFFVQPKYDYVIDLDNTLYLRLASILRRSAYLTYDHYRWEKWLMVNLKINKLSGIHLVERMWQAAASLELEEDNLGLDYFIPDKDHVPVEWLPEDFQNGFVVFAITAAYETRKLPVTRLVELCDKINKPVILLGLEEDVQTGQHIEQFFQRSEDSKEWEPGLIALGKKTIIYNGCGKFNVSQMASLIKRSSCVFSYDSFFVPIASAFKKQLYLLLGNTITLFGRYPYKTKFVVLENNKVNCRPCSAEGYSRCPKGHFKCMKEIVFDFYLP